MLMYTYNTTPAKRFAAGARYKKEEAPRQGRLLEEYSGYSHFAMMRRVSEVPSAYLRTTM